MLLAIPPRGSFWLLYLLGYNMSIAVWVGIIALAGLDAETGVVMLLYLELAHAEWEQKGLLKTLNDLKEAVMHGAVKRIRPKIMTVSVILAGLIPVMFSHGAGSDIMKRIAAPMVVVTTSTTGQRDLVAGKEDKARRAIIKIMIFLFMDIFYY